MWFVGGFFALNYESSLLELQEEAGRDFSEFVRYLFCFHVSLVFGGLWGLNAFVVMFSEVVVFTKKENFSELYAEPRAE